MRTRNNSSSGNATQRSHGSSLRELGAPLDQERAASMADEGGVAGAITDASTQAAAHSVDRSALVTTRTVRSLRKVLPWAMLAGGVMAGLAIAAVVWQRQQQRY